MTKGLDTIDTSDNTITTANAVISRNEKGKRHFGVVQENDGQWGFAGGAKDIEDVDTVATLHRELSEELALVPKGPPLDLSRG